jgi:phosphatidate cytidylyltransferase
VPVSVAPASTPVAAPARSRAGRDLPAAIAVGLLLGAAVLVSLLTVRQSFIAVVAVAVAVGTWELAGVLRRAGGIEVGLPPVLVGGQLVVWLAWPLGARGVLVGFVLAVLAVFGWRFRGGVAGFLRDVSGSVFTVVYVAVFAAFAALLVLPADGVARELCFLIGVVVSDIGGYVAGVLLGRHPMAPAISPKKSWEGAAGSALAGAVAGALTLSLLLHVAAWKGVLFGLAIVVSATLGDLTESLLKRDLGVKDMGTLLPGHGGLMDRLDSLLPSAVTSWLLLTALVPGG